LWRARTIGHPIEKERAMKLNTAQIEQTLTQLDGEAIPDEHPMLTQLEKMFGTHTFFLDNKGLNIIEPLDAEKADGHLAVVISLADWADSSATSLRPHTPESRDVVVDLGDTLH
jgi:hypothetical protein